MKVLVAVKRVVDHNVKVRVNEDQTGVDLNNVKMSMNPFCEIAVEEAVRLKEKGLATEVVAVSIGPEKSQEQLRTAMALGVDRGILITTEAEVSSLAVAKLLAKVAAEEQPQVILLGKQSIDTDNNQTAQMLAALTGYAQGAFAAGLEISADQAQVKREIDGGTETLAIKLPAVISADLRLNEPRYAKLPDIMKAKKKPLVSKTPADYGVDISSKVKLLKVEAPVERSAGIKVASVDELIDKLKNEAKVV